MVNTAKSIKRLVKKAARALGFELVSVIGSVSEIHLLERLIDSERISVVIDIGANQGQYGKLLRSIGFKGKIFSIEPLKGPHALLATTASSDAAWTVCRQLAIGEAPGVVQMNVSENSVSSSLLPLLARHTEAAPRSFYVETETVELETLDRFADTLSIGPRERVLLKIDTQGYEDAVLRGAEEFLGRVSAVQCELSLQPLYDGQALIEGVIELLRDKGFLPIGFSPGFRDPESLDLLQCDGFFRKQG